MVTIPSLLRWLLPALLLAWGAHDLSAQNGEQGPSADQRATALRRVAAMPTRTFQGIAAKLRLGVDTALAWRQLDTMLARPTGDMFWLYPAAGMYFYCRDLMTDAWRDRFRQTLRLYTPYRGDTENHFLMYYGSLLLFSQEWPGLPGEAWFNGKSSRENYAEAKEYLEQWIDTSARQGITEWDSPRYLYYYVTPLLTLSDFTADTLLRRRLEMTLEMQLADYAAEYLDGSYCGAHARDGDNSVIDPRNSEANSYAQFYFEDSLGFVLHDLAFAAMSRFSCPEIIRCIAHDRGKMFEHLEMKRSRAKMRYAPELHTAVRKYDYMTPDYCMGSMDGGLQQPIQQHSWGVTFASRRPNNTIFGLHPQSSAEELGTFFPEEPELMAATITQSKASYASDTKWVGGSPYERLFQYRSTLIAVYDIPEKTSAPHVDLFLPKTLDTIIRDAGGWTICRMEGAFVGIRFLGRATPEWIEEERNWRLRSNDLHTRYIVECGSAREMTFEEFVAALTAIRPADHIQSTEDEIHYIGRNGDMQVRLNAAGGENAMIVRDAPANDPIQGSRGNLFLGPHLKSRIGSGVLEMRCGGMTRTLDFVHGTIRE